MPTLQPTPPVHPVRRILAAGSPGRTVIEVPGTTFRITEATGPVAVKIDEGGEFPFALGMAFTCPNGTGFQRIEVQNLTDAENTVEVLVTAGTITDDRLNVVDGRVPLSVMEQPSDLISIFAGNIEPGESVELTDAVPAGYRRRRAVMVANGSKELRLQIVTSGGAIASFVPVEQVHTITASGAFSVRNPHGTAVECYVSAELYRA